MGDLSLGTATEQQAPWSSEQEAFSAKALALRLAGLNVQ